MEYFFAPRSVVLIGVSRQSGIGAYNNLEMMERYGYAGRIHVVHPKVPEILGHKTHSSVAALPEVPDLAIISVGRERVLPVFGECAAKGIRRVIVISQGFADADERGKELQQQLVTLARNHGVRVVGPNTMGVLNPFADFSSAFVDITKDLSPPPLAIVVQSGVFQVGYESFTTRVGKAIDVGNGCDVDFVDVLNYLEHDPQTQIIALHLEGMRRGREFLEVAARIARSKPIIVLKTGRSAAGAKAALSHTGSLVGEDALFDLAFAKAGLIRVRSMVELRAVCQAFLHFRTMAGPRLGVVTATGACGIMAADACEDYGLELAAFPEAIRAGLENSHIAWHRLHNPVDIWPLGMVGGSFTTVFQNALSGLLQDDGVDAVLGIVPALSSPLHADLDLLGVFREIQAVNVRHKPTAIWFYADAVTEKSRELAQTPDVACFGSIDEAIMGLAGLHRYQRFLARPALPEGFFAAAGAPFAPPPGLPAEGLLVGAEALDLLKPYQIPQVPGALVHDDAAAVAFAEQVGYPLVLKIISPQWLHKSDLGGVRLNVISAEMLRKSYTELVELFQQRTPHGELNGILIQRQIQGTELLMGIKRDQQFGPVLVAGMGGVYTEVFRDVARALVPVTRGDAEEMLRALRIYPILQGVRGQKGVDLSALVDTLLALSSLARDYPQINELDLNPVLATSDGCWCVDCRIVLG
jgi:acetate---CoA ligase (ADP-forming)